MHPLEEAIKVKGSPEFTRSELVGILSFRLRRMSPTEAKKAIEEWIEEGLLEEREGKFLVVIEKLEEEKDVGSLLGEMVSYIARSLGWNELEVLEGVKKMRERYGELDDAILAYLFGMEKGVDMSKFRDRLPEL
ncbi:DUF2240 family protein [Thermococcus peptonophilus]|uniref:DUF2240 domain-containing protein n=1 Tax=Thermococcus peptonophilus TaxID=53952 RepID=A0A142CXN6_9EURY|nr:DUF2240 family protein [Thermococcus peptonophilus]AMQ19538.1 hypothetical protein A0127_06965 [Thermococcus peptonophilus]